jgi:hypothetical protein
MKKESVFDAKLVQPQEQIENLIRKEVKLKEMIYLPNLVWVLIDMPGS